MSNRQAPAISTLVRWRAFQEALAERSCQEATGRVAKARDEHATACEAAATIGRRREDMLSAGILDLALLQAIAEFEREAWDEQVARRDALHERERERDEALSAHFDARTRTRVAESRHDRIAAELRDHEEKKLFDQMASLLVASAIDSHSGDAT